MSRLDEYRNEIDEIDNGLVELFCKRMQVSEKISAYKKENGLPTYAPGRERALLARVSDMAGEECGGYTEALYKTILAASRSYQNAKAKSASRLFEAIRKAVEKTPRLFPQRAAVACCAQEGSTEQLVCETLVKNPSPMFFDTVEHTLRAVQSGMCALGVMRIENADAGIHAGIVRRLTEHGLYIVRSVKTERRCVLAAQYGTKNEDIRRIYTDAESAGACSDFLSGVKNAETVITGSDAESARRAFEDPASAAIAGGYTCEHFGLDIRRQSVQDRDAYERYVCFAKSFDIYPGADRVLFSFTLQNTAGVLYALLAKFSASGVNVRQIRSAPLPGREFELRVMMEADISVYAPELETLLRDLETECGDLHCLGVFSEVK